MMIVVKEIKDEVYQSLIEYAYKKCDAVMFVIRKDIYVNDPIKRRTLESNMCKFESHLKRYLKYQRDGGHWCGSKVIADDCLFQVSFYQFSEKVKKVLLKNHSFYDWLHPNYPEDIAFFKDGYCWLYSVSHERMCSIYYDTEKEYQKLVEMGIEFDEMDILSFNDKFYEYY